MKLRAVIFDYGNVICRPPTQQQLLATRRNCAGSQSRISFRLSGVSGGSTDRGTDARDYWLDIAQASGRVFDETLITEMMRHEVDFWGRFDDRVLSWARDLRAAGLRTGILSNLPRTLGERLRGEAGFLDHFDQVTFSYELGFIKPEAPIYRHVIEGLGVEPAEALFLDDRPENVEGALAVGIQAEVFNSWEEFLDRDCLRYGLPLPDSL